MRHLARLASALLLATAMLAPSIAAAADDKTNSQAPPDSTQIDRIGKGLGASPSAPPPANVDPAEIESGQAPTAPGNGNGRFTPSTKPQQVPASGGDKTPPGSAELDRIGKGLGAAPGGAPPPVTDPGSLQSGRSEGSVLDLQLKLEALQARIAALEKGVLKAPLTVLDANGRPILQLSADGYLLLGSDGGNQIGLVAQPGSPARIGVQSGTSVAQMSAGNGKAAVEVFNGESNNVTLAASAGELGVVVERNGQPAAGLGSMPGKGVALRLFDKSGKQVAAAGENPATPGSGIVTVGNGSRNAAALAANGDGSGVVHAYASDGTVGSGLIGVDRMVAAYNASGAAVVTIGRSENSEGGNVTSRDPTGEGVFRAGFNSAVGGGDACVYRAKKQQVYCLGLGVPGVGVVGR